MLTIQTRVVFNPRLKCFYDTQERKRLKGAAKLLAKRFWPAYSFRRAPRGAAPAEGAPPPPPPTERGRACTARQGRARGTLVDREVARAINGQRLRSPHPFTTYALEALRRARIRAVAAQVVVFDAGIATAVDILGADEAGTLCCVELKCSSDSRYGGACGPMRGVLAGRVDSLREQHAVQVQVTRLLFERTYGCRANAYVLRVNERGATLSSQPRAEDAARALEELTRRSRGGRRRAAASS